MTYLSRRTLAVTVRTPPFSRVFCHSRYRLLHFHTADLDQGIPPGAKLDTCRAILAAWPVPLPRYPPVDVRQITRISQASAWLLPRTVHRGNVSRGCGARMAPQVQNENHDRAPDTDGPSRRAGRTQRKRRGRYRRYRGQERGGGTDGGRCFPATRYRTNGTATHRRDTDQAESASRL
ncbi:Uncharacterised protein [Mycobacteroides abscessus subsp. abscessus]|nr:Uncharacterised protein [Mycobacteroides abscessus subsp. abscessus]